MESRGKLGNDGAHEKCEMERENLWAPDYMEIAKKTSTFFYFHFPSQLSLSSKRTLMACLVA